MSVQHRVIRASAEGQEESIPAKESSVDGAPMPTPAAEVPSIENAASNLGDAKSSDAPIKAEAQIETAAGSGQTNTVAPAAVASATTPAVASSEKDLSLEASEALLRGAFRVIHDIFRLCIVLPLSFIIKALGFGTPNPRELISSLEKLRESGPVDTSTLLSVLRSLNRTHPEAAVEFLETKVLLQDAEAQQQPQEADVSDGGSGVNKPGSSRTLGNHKYPVNAEVVKQYMVALVKSGKISSYSDERTLAALSAVPLQGRSHRSLGRLLDEMKAASEGSPLPTTPGASVSRPLHVIVQGGASALAGREPTGLLATLYSWFWFLSTCLLFAFLWGVGSATVRRLNSGADANAAAGGILGASGITAQAAATSSIVGQPKEYSKENIPEKSVKSFKDVKGCDEAITELEEIVAYLKNPDKFTRLGGKLPKGVLLTGPPGTGKTLLAKAVAGEAGVPFFYKAGSEFDEMFVGVGSRRVRSLFAAAKKKAPCIVFIDEIDAIGGKRTTWESSGGSRKTLNQLLTDMDGFEENSGVVVMAATNLPEFLDSALTRPGRFDRRVAVSLPDVRGRKQIIDLYLSGKPIAADVDAENLARRTPGFSGAQLANLVNEAALLAARNDADAVTAALLDEARDKVLMGSPRALAQSLEARRLTAYHEGGHALVALYTPGAKPIHKATIVPRGHALGMVVQVPDKDEYSTTKQQMMAHIDVAMGGKAAEELIFGPDKVTTGATSDLKTATTLAKHMVENCGMSQRIGPMALDGDDGAVGGDIRKAADEEITSILKEAYARVADLLKAKESELHTLATTLLEKETLTQREIKELLWGVAAAEEESVLKAAEEAAEAAATAAFNEQQQAAATTSAAQNAAAAPSAAVATSESK